MLTLDDDRVRVRRWQGADVDLGTVIAKLREQQIELAQHDADGEEHPHPRNCVLNLVVTVAEHHRAEACDRMVAGLAASHPLRAILIHRDGGHSQDVLDAEITTEAHQLFTGSAVQREQVLLHVRGDLADHLSSLIEPLLVPDVPTFLWWNGRERLDEHTVRDVMSFAEVLVVDSERFERPVEALLQVAELNADPEATVGVADFRWGRLRPWRDAIGQFFAPADRRPLLPGLSEVQIDAAGSGPEARVGAALLAGWLAAALGWRFVETAPAGVSTRAEAQMSRGRRVRLTLRSEPGERVGNGEVLALRLTGRTTRGPFGLSIERDGHGDGHAHVTIDLGRGEPVRQRLTLPRMGDPDLLVRVLWTSQREPVFRDSLAAAVPLLEALR